MPLHWDLTAQINSWFVLKTGHNSVPKDKYSAEVSDSVAEEVSQSQ